MLKTARFYFPSIIHNRSNIHFTLHNSYATTLYIKPKGVIEASEYDMPSLIIAPISNKICICLALINGEVDLSKSNFDIPIEVWEKDDEIIKHFIDGYITYNAKSFVVDDTNIEIVKKLVTKKAAIKAKADAATPPDPQIEIFKELISSRMKPSSHYKETKIGRNDLCPCGSGKKYKKCCLDKL